MYFRQNASFRGRRRASEQRGKYTTWVDSWVDMNNQSWVDKVLLGHWAVCSPVYDYN